MTTNEPDWMVPLGGVLDFDIDRDGDHWSEYVIEALATSVGWRSVERRGSDRCPTARPIFEITVVSESLHSRLWLLQTPEGVQGAVVGDGEETDHQVAPWRNAAMTAMERLNHRAVEFPWHAAIGPNGTSKHQNLAEEMSVGPLRLSPGNVCFRKSVPLVQPTFQHPGAVFPSWPIIVNGTVRSVRWDLGSSVAARQLHRLCALLSLACDEHWVVRQSPMQRGEMPLAIPRFGAGDTTAATCAGEFPAASTRDLVLSPWIVPAWDTLELNAGLDRAAAAYHEGADLMRQHPSFGLVAFVGAIEAVGNWLPDQAPEPCETCGNVPKAAARFRRALELVMPANDAKKYCTTVYGKRSKAAHDGVLFGTESLVGSYEAPGVLRYNSALDFRWRELAPLQAIARGIVTKAIIGAGAPPAD